MPLPARAQNEEQTKAIIYKYRLTDDTLRKYTAIEHAVKRDAPHDPQLRADEAAVEKQMERDDSTLAKFVEYLRARPKLDGYVRRGGLQESDMLLFPLGILSAFPAVMIAPDKRNTFTAASPENVRWVVAHQQQLQQIGQGMQP